LVFIPFSNPDSGELIRAIEEDETLQNEHLIRIVQTVRTIRA